MRRRLSAAGMTMRRREVLGRLSALSRRGRCGVPASGQIGLFDLCTLHSPCHLTLTTPKHVKHPLRFSTAPTLPWRRYRGYTSISACSRRVSRSRLSPTVAWCGGRDAEWERGRAMTTSVSPAFHCLMSIHYCIPICSTVLVVSTPTRLARSYASQHIHPVLHFHFTPRVLPSN